MPTIQKLVAIRAVENHCSRGVTTQCHQMSYRGAEVSRNFFRFLKSHYAVLADVTVDNSYYCRGKKMHTVTTFSIHPFFWLNSLRKCMLLLAFSGTKCLDIFVCVGGGLLKNKYFHGWEREVYYQSKTVKFTRNDFLYDRQLLNQIQANLVRSFTFLGFYINFLKLCCYMWPSLILRLCIYELAYSYWQNMSKIPICLVKSWLFIIKYGICGSKWWKIPTANN